MWEVHVAQRFIKSLDCWKMHIIIKKYLQILYCIHIMHIVYIYNILILTSYTTARGKNKIFHKEGKILTNVGVLGMMLLKNVWFSHLFKLYSKTGKSQCLIFWLVCFFLLLALDPRSILGRSKSIFLSQDWLLRGFFFPFKIIIFKKIMI